MRLALAESEQLGHGYIGTSMCSWACSGSRPVWRRRCCGDTVLDLASARAELQRLSAAGLMPRSRADDAGALGPWGSTWRRCASVWLPRSAQTRSGRRSGGPVGGRGGAAAAGAARRCAARRSSPSAPCTWPAAMPRAGRRAPVTPEHLLHGVLRDLEDPYGAQLGRRGRRHLAQLGWTIGRSIRLARCCRHITSIRSGCGLSLTACPPDLAGVAAVPEPGVVQAVRDSCHPAPVPRSDSLRLPPGPASASALRASVIPDPTRDTNGAGGEVVPERRATSGPVTGLSRRVRRRRGRACPRPGAARIPSLRAGRPGSR